MTPKSRALKIKQTQAFKKGKTSGNYSTHEERSKMEMEYRKQASERPSKYQRIIK